MARHSFTQPTRDYPYAYGQVLVAPFEITLEELKQRLKCSLDDEETALIIKPHFKGGAPAFKFTGGMLLDEHELPKVAANRELLQETGIVCHGDVIEIYKTYRKRHHPDSGEFPIYLMLAFGCDFSKMFDPAYGETGDEEEEPMRVRFGDITPQALWEIPTQPGKHAPFFKPYLKMLEAAVGTFGTP